MQTVQSEVTTALRKMILTYQLRPGERLVQDDLAKQLEVSRTPVREAIRQLETEGLVTILPYKGATVSVVTSEEIEEIYQVRIALESRASWLAMQHISPDDIQTLAAMVDTMRMAAERHDPEASLNINREFYIYFYTLAKQKRLFELIIKHIDLARRFRRQHFYDGNLSRDAVASHEQLITIIQTQNALAVSSFIADELQRSVSNLRTILQRQQADYLLLHSTH